jgi:hypothetical protein
VLNPFSASRNKSLLETERDRALPIEDVLNAFRHHVISAPEREGLSLLEGLDRLLGEQAARRRDRGIKRRITTGGYMSVAP